MTVTPKFALPIIALSDSMAVIPAAWNTMFTNLDSQVGIKNCTSGTRPGSPYSGQLIYETDTHLHRIWSVIDAAWVLIVGTPLGLVAQSQTLTTTTNTTIGTEAMVGTITFPSYYNHIYRVHFEGYIANSTNSTSLQTQIRSRWADGAGAVTIANTLSDSIFCDPLNLTAAPTGIDVKSEFAFDMVQRSVSTNANSSAGWSFINSGSIGSSGAVVGGNISITVEDMGLGGLT